MSDRWYVLAVEPQFDAIVAKKLARPDPFSGRPAFPVLWPHFKVSRVRNLKLVEDIEPMFPGYLFFRSDCRREAPQHWTLIKTKVMVVAGILPLHCQYPSPVPDSLIDLIMRCTQGGEAKVSRAQLAKALDVYFREGKLILDESVDDPFGQVDFILDIIDGPFGGRAGVCTAADYETATVRLNVFGRDTEIRIEQAHIGPERRKQAQHLDKPSRKGHSRRNQKDRSKLTTKAGEENAEPLSRRFQEAVR